MRPVTTTRPPGRLQRLGDYDRSTLYGRVAIAATYLGGLFIAGMFIAVGAGAKPVEPTAHGIAVTIAALIVWFLTYIRGRSTDTAHLGTKWDRILVSVRFWTMAGVLLGGGLILVEAVETAAPKVPAGGGAAAFAARVTIAVTAYTSTVTVAAALIIALARAVRQRRTLATDIALLLRRAQRGTFSADDYDLLQQKLAATWLWKSGASFVNRETVGTIRDHLQTSPDPALFGRLIEWSDRVSGQGSP